jgi:hypothetical protein
VSLSARGLAPLVLGPSALPRPAIASHAFNGRRLTTGPEARWTPQRNVNAGWTENPFASTSTTV